MDIKFKIFMINLYSVSLILTGYLLGTSSDNPENPLATVGSTQILESQIETDSNQEAILHDAKTPSLEKISVQETAPSVTQQSPAHFLNLVQVSGTEASIYQSILQVSAEDFSQLQNQHISNATTQQQDINFEDNLYQFTYQQDQVLLNQINCIEATCIANFTFNNQHEFAEFYNQLNKESWWQATAYTQIVNDHSIDLILVKLEEAESYHDQTGNELAMMDSDWNG